MLYSVFFDVHQSQRFHHLSPLTYFWLTRPTTNFSTDASVDIEQPEIDHDESVDVEQPEIDHECDSYDMATDYESDIEGNALQSGKYFSKSLLLSSHWTNSSERGRLPRSLMISLWWQLLFYKFWTHVQSLIQGSIVHHKQKNENWHCQN